MASHEWLLEHIIKVEELSDHEDEGKGESVSSNEESCASDENNEACFSGESVLLDGTGQKSSVETVLDYDLSPSFAHQATTPAFPLSSLDLYAPPWSPLNISYAPEEDYPSTSPNASDGHQDNVRGPLDNQFLTLQYTGNGNALTAGLDKTTSPSIHAAASEFSDDFAGPPPRPYFFDLPALDPCKGASPQSSYASSEPWAHDHQEFDEPLNTFGPYDNPSKFTPFPWQPSPWRGTQIYQDQTPWDGPNSLHAGVDTELRAGSSVSPKQLMRHDFHHSSDHTLPTGDVLWPPTDLLQLDLGQHLDITHHPGLPVHPETEQSHNNAQQSVGSPDAENSFDGYQILIERARRKWGNVGARDQSARDEALLEMRQWGMSYKDIKHIGKFPEALATLRGRHRVMTTPSQERQRRPKWLPRDEELLRDAVRAQLVRPRVRASMHIGWKEVANYLHRHGSSYKFSYVTCSQKWKQLSRESPGFGNRAVVRSRGRGAVYM